MPNHTRLEESKNFEIKSQYFIIVLRSTTTAPKEKCVFKENICTFSFPSKNINYNFISGISQYIYRIPLKKNFNYYNTTIWFFARISKDLSRYGFYQLKMQLRVHNGMMSWVILSFTVLSEKKALLNEKFQFIFRYEWVLRDQSSTSADNIERK